MSARLTWESDGPEVWFADVDGISLTVYPAPGSGDVVTAWIPTMIARSGSIHGAEQPSVDAAKREAARLAIVAIERRMGRLDELRTDLASEASVGPVAAMTAMSLAAVRDAGRAYLAAPAHDRDALVMTILAAAGVAPSADPLADQRRPEWAVLIHREGGQLKTTFATFEVEENARCFFGRASEQWSESYLLRVVKGPSDDHVVPAEEG